MQVGPRFSRSACLCRSGLWIYHAKVAISPSDRSFGVLLLVAAMLLSSGIMNASAQVPKPPGEEPASEAPSVKGPAGKEDMPIGRMKGAAGTLATIMDEKGLIGG